MMCNQLGIKHICTITLSTLKPIDKVEAFWKIIKTMNSFILIHLTRSKNLIYNLGNFLFEYNHLRRHGGIAYQNNTEKLEKITELLSLYNGPLTNQLKLKKGSTKISLRSIRQYRGHSIFSIIYMQSGEDISPGRSAY